MLPTTTFILTVSLNGGLGIVHWSLQQDAGILFPQSDSFLTPQQSN